MSFTIPDNDEAFNNNQSIWMQTDINALIAAINGDGVVSGCAVSEDGGGASMDLDITSGTMQLSDTAYTITGSAAAVTIGTADGSNPRIDLVCAKSDDTLNVTAGTAAANPKAPDIPASSVILAMVYVPASDTTIADNQITDKRVIVREVVATTTTSIQTHVVLESETLSSAGSFDFSSIDQTYDHLIVRLLLRGDVAAIVSAVRLYYNNDTTDANYQAEQNYSVAGTDGGLKQDLGALPSCPAATSIANDFGMYDILIPEYAGGKRKTATALTGGRRDAATPSVYAAMHNWESTAAINRITIVTDNDPTDEFVAGSYVEIIGVKEQSVLIAA